MVGWGEVIPPQGEAEGPKAVGERGPTWLRSSRPRCRGGTGGGGGTCFSAEGTLPPARALIQSAQQSWEGGGVLPILLMRKLSPRSTEQGVAELG